MITGGAFLLTVSLLFSMGTWEDTGPGGTNTISVCTVSQADDTDVLFALCYYYPYRYECRRSFDNGENWELCASPDFTVTCLCSDSYGRLFIGGTGCVMISSDLGQSWTTSVTYSNASIQNVTADPSDPQHLLAAALEINSPLLESNDGGVYWDKLNSLPPGSSGKTVCFAPSNPDVAYFAGFDQTQPNKIVIYKTTDSGDSWVDASYTLPFSISSNPCIDLVVSNEDQDVVCANANKWVIHTEDGGTDWDVTCTANYNITDLALSETPGTVYAVSSDKLYTSSDYGETWQVSSDLSANAYSVTTSSMEDGERIHTGCLNGQYYTDDPGGDWIFSNNGIPGGNVFSLLQNEYDDTGFPVSTGFNFLNEEQYSWDGCGALPFDKVYYVARSYSDPEIVFSVGDAG